MREERDGHPQLDDLPLGQDPEAPPPPAVITPETNSRRRWFLGVIGALLLLAIVIAYVIFRQWVQPEPSLLPPPPAEPPVAAPLPPAEAPPPPIILPPLNDSDAAVRAATAGLSDLPAFARMLQMDDLIRRFTATVDNLAEGVSPRSHLSLLAPREPFQVTRKGQRIFIDPASYRRFDPLVDAALSIDPQEAARLFRGFEPLVESAYRELGYPDDGFRTKLTAAIEELLATPIVDGEVELEPLVVTYAFKDPALEGLSPAQKHLLRTGPRNGRVLHDRLRRLAQELELPIN